MEFNDIWTKEVNDKYRCLVKEKTDFSIIEKTIGKEIMKHHPNGKFIRSFENFSLNEIIYSPKETEYILYKQKNNSLTNYKIEFSTRNDDYILYLTGDIDKKSPYPTKEIHHFYFTTKSNNNKEEFEKLTNYNEFIELIKRMMYIINDINKSLILVIGETENPQKINIYLDVMKNSYSVIKGDSSRYDNKDAYYFI